MDRVMKTEGAVSIVEAGEKCLKKDLGLILLVPHSYTHVCTCSQWTTKASMTTLLMVQYRLQKDVVQKDVNRSQPDPVLDLPKKYFHSIKH